MTTHDTQPASTARHAITVRKVVATEAAPVARTLARAFYDDPFVMWQLHGDERRLELVERGFRLFLERIWLRHDECWTTERVAGAALWEPPGTWELGAGRQLLLMPSMLSTFGRHLPRTLKAFGVMEAHHPKAPHYYLPILGVDPDRQRQGIGSALLRPVLARCDRENVGAYLEATSPRNRVLYERHGFTVTEELRVTAGAPPLALMWREPRTDS
jgi:GNAT superfamily N-acetyltransferase